MNKEMFRKIRKEKGYTQKQLADYIGFVVHYISLMENGHKKITRRTALVMNHLPKNYNKKLNK